MQLKLTHKEKWMLEYLKSNRTQYLSPTEVGKAYGNSKGKKNYHSAEASPVLLKLVKKNLVERNEHGHYRYISLVLEKTLDPDLRKLSLPNGVLIMFETGTDTSAKPHSATGSYPTKVRGVHITNPESNSGVVLSSKDITTIQERINLIERTWGG